MSRSRKTQVKPSVDSFSSLGMGESMQPIRGASSDHQMVSIDLSSSNPFVNEPTFFYMDIMQDVEKASKKSASGRASGYESTFLDTSLISKMKKYIREGRLKEDEYEHIKSILNKANEVAPPFIPYISRRDPNYAPTEEKEQSKGCVGCAVMRKGGIVKKPLGQKFISKRII
jgi:hypothetical protein